MASVTRVEISPAQRTYYDELFRLADVDNDGVIGVKDAGFFRKSGLADGVLGEIWQMADPRKDGFLDRDGFTVALSLISVAQQGKKIALESLRPAPPPPKLEKVPRMKEETQPGVGWVIAPQDKMQYQTVFRATDDDNDGFITGNQARSLFGNSGLPMPVLGQIWAMADINQDQKLDFTEFCIAMFLIAVKKKGQELPPALPESLITSAREPLTTPNPNTNFGLTSTMQNEWVIPPPEKAKFEALFKKNDTDHDGFITGEQARELFSRSGLSNQELGKIWVLSDINQDQKLDRAEFFIAMALINRRISGREIPVALPEALTNSARDIAPSPAPIPKRTYELNMDEFESNSAHTTPAASPALAHTIPMDPADMSANSTPITSPATTGPRFGNPPTPVVATTAPLTMSAGIPGGIPPHMSNFAAPGGVMSPHIATAPIPQPYPGPPSSVPLTPSPALELERTRQVIAQQERIKAETGTRLQAETNAANEAMQQLTEERTRLEACNAEIRELENQVTNQKNRGAAIRDQISETRLELKSVKSQQEHLELVLKEKREQNTEQEDILNMLKDELVGKTAEVALLQREIDAAKAKLETLRTATTDAKAQLVGVKKTISDSKSELQKLTDEAKSLAANRRSVDLSSVSPGVPLRPISPAVFTPQPSTSPPIPRATLTETKNSPGSLSKPSFPPSPTFATVSPITDFNFNGNDTFTFDNGKDDPFNRDSKDGFGFGSATQDSFGSGDSGSATSSPFGKPSSVVNDGSSSFFSASDPFGESKDPFSTSKDPFAAVRETFGGSSFGFGQESFGSPNVPRTPANSVIAGSTPTPANSVIAGSTPTPANSVIAGSTPTPANSVIAGTTPTPANSVIAPPTPANSVIAPKDPSHHALSEEAFKASFFAAAKFDSDSFGGFGSSDAFGANDAFGTTSDAFGTTTDAFGNTSDSFGSTSDAFGSATSDTFGSTTSDAFGSVTNDAFGGNTSDAFGATNDAFASSDAFASTTSDAFGSSDAFGADTSDAFGQTNEAFGSGQQPGKVKTEFGTPSSNAFGTSDAFGTPFTNTFDFTTDKSESFF
jgi:epidermal growth factor receptor substrate 15